ncbi:MAG: division plane positioning ATPase MipZ [Alphaproteobacteria bacterium]
MRILLIDDDPIFGRSIVLMLRSEGFDCDRIETGEGAIEAIKYNRYDLILLDLMLPDIDGYELIGEIRAARIEKPILVLSALGDLSDKIKGLGLGADDYLTKPFDQNELLARIRAAIRRSKGLMVVGDAAPLTSSLLAKKGAATPWAFAASYTPSQRQSGGLAHGRGRGGDAPDGAANAPAEAPRQPEAVAPAVEDTAPPAKAADPERSPKAEGAPAPAGSRMGRRARVIVLGNEKGGSGKSTTAMHLIVALLREGAKVASVDIDTRQGTLTRYIENRRAFTASRGVDLPSPGRHLVGFEDADPRQFEAAVEGLLHSFDYVVIDTPGRDGAISHLAHGWADTLITPINDSFIDLDILAQVQIDSLNVVRPSHYSQVVWDAKDRKGRRDGSSIDWIVIRNRVSPIGARNASRIVDALARISERVGFRSGPGLSERVIYRELFLLGLTLLDLRDVDTGVALTMSHITARREIRALLDSVGIHTARAESRRVRAKSR